MTISYSLRLIGILVCSLGFLPSTFAKTDSLAPAPSARTNALLRQRSREAKHYIRPTLWISNFRTAPQSLSSRNTVAAQNITNRLGDYRFAQTNIGFYAPIYTQAKFKGNDTTHLNTFHLLVTANLLNDRPQFSALTEQHVLYKTGIGMRAIWAFGSDHVILYDASPFVTGDRLNKATTKRFLFASTLVWNCTPRSAPGFSFRLGITRTFLLGNRFSLPMVGFRVGRLDGKVYFSAQFPRNAVLVYQPNPKISITAFTRVYGGFYNVSNSDSLYFGTDSVIQFGRTGLANGLRLDVRASKNFSFFLSGGMAANNRIWLYSSSFNQGTKRPFRHFYDAKTESTPFIHVGVSFRFGKAKNSAGNTLLYDVFDLNNTIDPGDNNDGPGNGEIRRSGKNDAKQIQYRDVSDLIEETDLY
ncbi:MAG: hypothetical protein ACRCYO_04370 [Bacteroidia bacterium]